MAQQCGCGCGATIRSSSPSPHFASEACQRQWTRRQAGVPAAGRPTLPPDIVAALEAAAGAGNGTAYYDPPYIYTTETGWVEIGYGATWQHGPRCAASIEVPSAPARWWSYDRTLNLWHLRESDGPTTTILHTITDECATRTPAGYIEDHLRRAIGGHIPTLPLAYLN